jgi:thiol:disulfide interchange protein
MNRQIIIGLIIALIIGLIIYWQSTKASLENFSKESSEKMTSEEIITQPTLNQPPVQNNKNKIRVMNFNTSWCKYSVMFASEWAKFHTMVEGLNNPRIEVLDIKCDNPDNEETCDKYQVPGFPTVVFEIGDNLEEYRGERSAEGLLEKLKTFI